MQQFTFRIKFWLDDLGVDEKIECKEISNRKTGEKLSIAYFADNSIKKHTRTLEIKRSKAEEKKGNKNGGK